MKQLIKSRKTGVFCVKCDGLIPANTSRFVDGGMHYHFNCTTKQRSGDRGFIVWLLNKIG